MTSRVIVRVTGRIGIDEAGHLLADLTNATNLDWREEHSLDDKHLAGIGELLFSAVVGGAVGKGTEMTVDVTVARVREVIGRMRRRWIDPPDIDVETEESPGKVTPDGPPEKSPEKEPGPGQEAPHGKPGE